MTTPVGWRRVKVIGIPLILRGVARLPLGVIERALALASIAQAFLEPNRIRCALDWARAHERSVPRRWRLVLALLAWRGIASARPVIAFMDVDECRRRLRLEGAEHLEAAARGGGVILLNFHLGPLVPGPILQAAGHTLVTTRMLLVPRPISWPGPRPGWSQFPPLESVLLPLRDPEARALGLARLRRHLLNGKTVRLAGDGLGREVFRVSAPGGEITVRGGWWMLRRQTRAKTLPLLSHREGRRLVVAVHPPLPDPVSDPAEDARICREALAPLLERYVRTFPEQCTLLAFSGEPRPSDA